MKTTLFGCEVASPIIVGSGPLSADAEGMIALHRAGAGAVVTKTIRDNPAINPEPHMFPLDSRSMVNADKWSTLTGERWVKKEVPTAVERGVKVIASVGHTPTEVERWVPDLDAAGASVFELVSYDASTLVPMVKRAREITAKPILAKVSPNWPATAKVAVDAVGAGADGITAIDSLGPVLSIDIHNASPSIGGELGMGWLTGAAIKALALRHVAEISSALGSDVSSNGTNGVESHVAQPQIPLVGTGGVTNASDAVEMLMAGASHIGICTLPILKGVGAIARFVDQLDELIASLGYVSIDDVRGRALHALFGPEDTGPHRLVFQNAPCKSCRLCVTRCPYRALTLDAGHITIDHDRCHRCGLCVPSCKYGNLKLERVKS